MWEYRGGNYVSTTKFPGPAWAQYSDRVQVLTLLARPFSGILPYSLGILIKYSKWVELAVPLFSLHLIANLYQCTSHVILRLSSNTKYVLPWKRIWTFRVKRARCNLWASENSLPPSFIQPVSQPTIHPDKQQPDKSQRLLLSPVTNSGAVVSRIPAPSLPSFHDLGPSLTFRFLFSKMRVTRTYPIGPCTDYRKWYLYVAIILRT